MANSLGNNFKIILQNIFFYLVGLVFLCLAKTKNLLFGYSAPKPFSINKYDECIEYDLHIVEQWLSYLDKYTGIHDYLLKKNILELGPGSDLGIGLYLLYKGIDKYNAIDVNNLVKDVPMDFYDCLFEKMTQLKGKCDVGILRNQLDITREGCNDKLNYIYCNDFNISLSFNEKSIDIIFSQASFEHFDNIEKTIRELSLVTRGGGIIIAEIDLKTHSRWIRDKDPNNIYRYHQGLYDLFYFRGIPNRVRPFRYRVILEKYGWEDIRIIPLEKMSDIDFIKIKNKLNKNFLNGENQMEYLTIMLCARKK